MMNIGEGLKSGFEGLKDTSDTPQLDARVLLKEVLQKDDIFILSHRDEIMSPVQERRYMEMIEARAQGKPVAYIIGYKEFMGFRFKVNEDTLIPRPDTEIAVELAIEEIRARGYHEVLDLCSGSGAIGLSIAGILEFTNVTLSDINKGALCVSEENAEDIGVKDRVRFIHSDLFDKIPERFDLIISNPPYINESDMRELSDSVRNYEPHTALYGGVQGLDFYRRISQEAREHLTNHGMLIFEIGYDQSQEVERMLKENGFENIKTVNDLAGHHRVVSGELIPET